MSPGLLATENVEHGGAQCSQRTSCSLTIFRTRLKSACLSKLNPEVCLSSGVSSDNGFKVAPPNLSTAYDKFADPEKSSRKAPRFPGLSLLRLPLVGDGSRARPLAPSSSFVRRALRAAFFSAIRNLQPSPRPPWAGAEEWDGSGIGLSIRLPSYAAAPWPRLPLSCVPEATPWWLQ